MNYRLIICYSITIIGAFLSNLGFLVVFIWPADLNGGWITFIGLLLIWGAWFDRINQMIWKNRIFIFRTIYLSFSQVLVLLVVVIPILLPNFDPSLYFTFETLLIVVLLGLIGVVIIYVDLYQFGIPEQIRGIAEKFMPLIQGLVLICTGALILIGAIYQNFEEPVNILLVISFRVFYSGIGLLLIYRMWFRTINHFIKQSIVFIRTYYREVITAGALIPVIYGALQFSKRTWVTGFSDFLFPSFILLTGYVIILAVWYIPSHPYSRGVNTALSSTLLFWSMVLIFYFQAPQSTIFTKLSHPGVLVSGTFFVFYLSMDTYLWRKELYRVFLGIWIFVKTYYREEVTFISLCFMLFGLNFWTHTDVLDWLKFGLFWGGYIAGVLIWYIPIRHDNYRGITTALSIGILLRGIFLFLMEFSDASTFFDIPLLVSYLLIGIGIVSPTYLWRVELWQVLKQSVQAIVQACVAAGLAILSFLKAGWNAIKSTFWTSLNFVQTYYREFVTVFSLCVMYIGSLGVWIFGFDQFNPVSLGLLLLGYLVGSAIWRFRGRHDYFRGITTTLSVFALLWGIFQLFLNLDITANFLDVPFLLSYLLIGIGIVLSTYLWRVELWQVFKQSVQAIVQACVVAGLAILGFLKAGWNAIKSAFWTIGKTIHEILRVSYHNLIRLFLYIQSNFWTVVRYFLSIVGFLMINVGFILLISGETIGYWWIFGGLLLICSSWWEITLQILRAIASSLRNFAVSVKEYLVKLRKYLWAKFYAIIEFGRIYFKPLVKTSTTIIGILLDLLGLTLFDTPNMVTVAIILIMVGTIILIFTWHKEIVALLIRIVSLTKNILETTGRFLWDSGVVIKKAIGDFIEYLWLIRIAILRAVMTSVGFILVIIALISNLDEIIRLALFITGLILFSSAWFTKIIELLQRIAKSFWAIIVAFGRFLWEIGITIRDAVDSFISYIVDRWREIVRAFTTVIGILLIILGISSLTSAQSSDEIYLNLGLILLGFIMITISWRTQIYAYVVRLINTLIDAVNQLIKACGELISRIWDQFRQIVRTTFDSGLYIAIVTLGVFAVGYGLILFISIFATPIDGNRGAWTKEVLHPIPILGFILWFIASILQGKSSENVTDLVGIFAYDEPYILFFLAIIFVGFGVALPIIFYFLRDSIKISSLRQKFGGSQIKEVQDDE
jgi:hypothetical protein